jgi:hypothetical protein
MFRHDRHYDYGLRGAPPSPDRRPQRFEREESRRAPRQRAGYDGEYERRADPRARMANRVTMRYTADYVYGGRGERYPINLDRYAGPGSRRINEPGAYHRPYMTEGGTRTWRGSMPPQRYDARDFGPNYGGRYPDEL